MLLTFYSNYWNCKVVAHVLYAKKKQLFHPFTLRWLVGVTELHPESRDETKKNVPNALTAANLLRTFAMPGWKTACE